MPSDQAIQDVVRQMVSNGQAPQEPQTGIGSLMVAAKPARSSFGMLPAVGAAFGTGSPAEEAEKPSGLASLLSGAYKALGDLSKRAILGSAADVQNFGDHSQPLQSVGPALETALNMAGAGMPMAERGAAGVFGGRLSQTADLGALAKAEKMHAKNAAPEKIWDKTGWFKGADDKWRYEIPDTAAKINPETGIALGRDVGLDEHLLHPDLKAAYPQLRETRVFIDPIVPLDSGGAHYIPGFGEGGGIGVSGATKNDLSAILHETQHRIQHLEGFEPGISPNKLASDGRPVGVDAYMKNAGETEARNVQTRAAKEYPHVSGGRPEMTGTIAGRRFEGTVKQYDALQAARREGVTNEEIAQMIADQRNKIPPWKTESVPRNDQILHSAIMGRR